MKPVDAGDDCLSSHEEKKGSKMVVRNGLLEVAATYVISKP